MTMINKEKVLKGVGKAVDAANNAADKAAAFAKEKELDKKAKNMAHTLEGYRTKRVDGLIPFNKRSVIIM